MNDGAPCLLGGVYRVIEHEIEGGGRNPPSA